MKINMTPSQTDNILASLSVSSLSLSLRATARKPSRTLAVPRSQPTILGGGGDNKPIEPAIGRPFRGPRNQFVRFVRSGQNGGGLRSEPWAASDQNAGRIQNGMGGRLISESAGTRLIRRRLWIFAGIRSTSARVGSTRVTHALCATRSSGVRSAGPAIGAGLTRARHTASRRAKRELSRLTPCRRGSTSRHGGD